jgi:type I restriction enzyme M protein
VTRNPPTIQEISTYAGPLDDLETRLWDAADQLRANSGLRSSEYSTPVLGLIFLRFADVKFSHADQQLRAQLPPNSRRTIGPADYQALGVMYLPAAARYSRLMRLPEGEDIGTALNEAMHAIEAENLDLRDTLPKTYTPAQPHPRCPLVAAAHLRRYPARYRG